MAAAFLVAFAALAVVVTRAAHRSADKAGLRDEIARQESTLKTLQSQIEEIQTVQGEAVFTDADRQALDDAREILNQRAFSASSSRTSRPGRGSRRSGSRRSRARARAGS
jgi:hypothetical protein